MFWDRVSGTHTVVERIPGAAKSMRRLMLTATGIGSGDAVLDVGCGAGSYFAPIRAALGDTGRLTGYDLAGTMIARARRRIAEQGWDNVEAHQADATTTDFGENVYDTAFAMYSLTAMPEYPAAIRRIHTALRPGGRLFVADVRLVPGGRAAPLIHLFRGMYRALAGVTGEDIRPALRAEFASVDLWDPHRNEPTAADLPHWPPLVMLVATKHRQPV